MTPNDYQKRALATSVAHDEPATRLANAILGIVGEAGEVAQFFARREDIQDPSLLTASLTMCAVVGDYMDTVKKWFFQGHDLPPEFIGLSFALASCASQAPFWAAITDYTAEPPPFSVEEGITDEDRSWLLSELGDIQWYIFQACDACGLTIEEVMDFNAQKLALRFPDGFSADASRNRDFSERDE